MISLQERINAILKNSNIPAGGTTASMIVTSNVGRKGQMLPKSVRYDAGYDNPPPKEKTPAENPTPDTDTPPAEKPVTPNVQSFMEQVSKLRAKMDSALTMISFCIFFIFINSLGYNFLSNKQILHIKNPGWLYTNPGLNVQANT